MIGLREEYFKLNWNVFQVDMCLFGIFGKSEKKDTQTLDEYPCREHQGHPNVFLHELAQKKQGNKHLPYFPETGLTQTVYVYHIEQMLSY